MHLRPTTLPDIPRCVTIHDAAFENDELSNFLNPHRAKYPLSWRQLALTIQRHQYFEPNTWGFVCVADADDAFADAGTILGCARWVRCPSKDEVATASVSPRRLSVLERVESWLCWAEYKWQRTLRTNPAVSWPNRDAFVKSIVASAGSAPISATTHWYLESLAVAPEYQRRGVARMLVSWGVQSAKAETEERAAVGKAAVPATLISSVPGLPLYRSLGFKVVGWEDDSFLGFVAEGGSNLVWDSTGYWIRDVEHEEPIKRGVVEAVYTNREKITQ